MSKNSPSGVSPEIMTALPRVDAGAVEPNVAPLRTNVAQGSFGYTIPLQTPPDRGGSQPLVALEYDPRRNGNGAFGMGWGVATPFIERRTDRGVPRFDPSDRFAFGDGTAIEMVSGGEYRPLVEQDFRRIRFVDPHWEVTETNGTVLTFGDSADSRLVDPANPTHVSAWYLARREDTNGNIIRYRYRRDTAIQRPQSYAAAQLYLHQIEYVFQPDGSHLCALRFDYETGRPDAWTSYRTGFPIRTNWLCRQITAFTSNIDGQPGHIGQPGYMMNFGGVPWDVAARDGAAADPFAQHGVYVRSSAAASRFTVEWPVPLTQARLALTVPADGARYRIMETAHDGTATTREEDAGPGYQIELGAAIRQVDVAALRGPLVVSSLGWPGANVPEIYSRYRLAYGAVIGEGPIDRSRIAPPTRLLSMVERAGYDEARQESRFPPLTMTYQPLSVAGTFPRPLRGTPSDALGARSTPLTFFGTGRPDLLQTVGGHRVYLNRGRIGAEIAVEGIDLVNSPSTQLGDSEVFLRDIEGRGAVDLTTTAFYYRNPSAAGTVSRTAPAWGTAVQFDSTQRHPQLSPIELQRSRSLDLDGDGQIDLLTTGNDFEEWTNLGGGSWAPVRRIPRRPSFGDKLFPDVSFDDAAVFIADMNGDGRDEIVRVSARKVEYWARSSAGWTFKYTMQSSPRYIDFDPARVLLVDVTGNGAADLVYLTGNGVDLVVNVGGSRFAAPIRLDFTDEGLSRGTPMPTSAESALAFDLLGDGTRGLLWSFTRADLEPNYFYLPLCSAGQPHLLSAFENGTGGRVELTYSTSSVQSSEDEANGVSWIDQPPYPVTVVSEIREIDRITRSQLVRRLRYRDGYYDRDDRAFRGFAIVEEIVVGTSARRGSRIVHRFTPGKPASTSEEDKAVARASAGAELTTSHFDLATGALLRRVDRHVETSLVRAFVAAGSGVATPVVTARGERIAFTWERRRLESSYEGTTGPRLSLSEQSRLITIGGTLVLDEYGRVVSETTFGEVVAAGAVSPVATFVIDGSTIALRAADTTRQRQVVYTYAEDRARHLVRHRSTEVTRAGFAFDRVIAETRRYFDGGSAADDFLPAGQVVQGNVQREERFVSTAADVQALVGAVAAAQLQDGQAPAWLRAGTTADGDAAWYAVERRRIFRRAGGRVEYGAIAQEVDAAGNAIARSFDAAAWYLRQQRNALNHLTDHQAISYRGGRPRRTVLPTGTITATEFDAFGRPRAVTEDAANSPMPQVTTDSNQTAFVAAGMPTSETVSRVINSAEVPVRRVVEVTYFDGWARVIQTRRSSQSSGTDYTVIDRRYDAGGQEPSFESLPYFSAGTAFTPPAAGQPGVSRYRDGLSRVIRIVFPDGREAGLDYAPWQIVVTDPEDADAASPHAGTPITYSFDFGRRVVAFSTTIRNGNGPGTAIATTRYAYDAADRLVRITDAEGTVTAHSLDARGDVQRLRHPDATDTVRLFDAHRRRIYERNAAGDEWCFAFDTIGRLTDDIAGADPTQAAAVVRRYDGAGPGTLIGQLVRAEVVSDNVVTQYAYDRCGHATSVTRTIGGVVVASDTMTYDDLGEVSRHDFTGGAALEWTRGIDGLLSRVRFTQADGTIVPMVDGIVYDPAGRVSGATICGGTVRYSSSFEASTYRMTSRAYVDDAGATLYRLANFVYDSVGNLRSYDEEAPPRGLVSWALAHDSLYRLRGATATRGTSAIASLEYRHNLASNVTRSDETATGQTLAYDAARPDLLTGVVGAGAQYTHDPAGRMRSTPAVTNMRWSARNRVDQLTAPGAPQLDVYYDHNRELLAVDSTAGGVTERSYYFSAVHERHGGVDRYVALLDGRQCVAARDDGTRVVLARGVADSITRTMDQAGVVIAGSTELYAPFGAPIEAANTPWPRGYAGGVRAVDGVYLMGARPYLAGLGRFAAADPVLFDSIPDDLLFEPRRVNPYTYALANPHTFIDPDGRLALIDDIIFYGVGWSTGLRNDSFLEGVGQNFVESWSVWLRTIVPFHSGTTPAQVAAWPVQLGWGGVNLAIGNLVAYGAVELFGAKTDVREHVQLITIPNSSFGAFTLGNKVIGDPATLAAEWRHEQGHYFQNLALGPMYLLVIALPSIIHAGLHPTIHPGQPYGDFYTETWADAWGK